MTMKQDDLDKTQYLGRTTPQTSKQQTTLEIGNGAARSYRLDDTQPVKPVDETMIQPPIEPAEHAGGVRELRPVPEKAGEKKQQAKKGRFTPKQKKAMLLTGGFLAALFCGFLISGYLHDKEQLAENSKVQATQMEQKQKALSEQEKELKDQREHLAQEKKELEAKQQELQNKAERMNGRNEQLADEGSSKSMLGTLVDKVTGKEKERTAATQQNAAQGAKASADADSVKQSIADAQTMINEVDAKLDDVGAMKQQAVKVKDAASSAYAEHAGTIQTVLHYAGEGVQLLKGLLSSN